MSVTIRLKCLPLVGHRYGSPDTLPSRLHSWRMTCCRMLRWSPDKKFLLRHLLVHPCDGIAGCLFLSPAICIDGEFFLPHEACKRRPRIEVLDPCAVGRSNFDGSFLATLVELIGTRLIWRRCSVAMSNAKYSSLLSGCLKKVADRSMYFSDTFLTSKLKYFSSMANRVSFSYSSLILLTHTRAVLFVQRVNWLSSNINNPLIIIIFLLV
jgi:hypothetical protein